jgi:hypothetical protein
MCVTHTCEIAIAISAILSHIMSDKITLLIPILCKLALNNYLSLPWRTWHASRLNGGNPRTALARLGGSFFNIKCIFMENWYKFVVRTLVLFFGKQGLKSLLHISFIMGNLPNSFLCAL